VQVYGRKSDAGPPFAVGVTHFTQSADMVADFLFTPANMGRWNDELCEKGEVCSACGSCVTPERKFRSERRVTTREQVLKMVNDDAALGYLIYYAEEALGITIVSSRVRAMLMSCAGTVLKLWPFPMLSRTWSS